MSREHEPNENQRLLVGIGFIEREHDSAAPNYSRDILLARIQGPQPKSCTRTPRGLRKKYSGAPNYRASVGVNLPPTLHSHCVFARGPEQDGFALGRDCLKARYDA